MRNRHRVRRGRETGTFHGFWGHDFGYNLRSRYSTRKPGDQIWFEVLSAYGHSVWCGNYMGGCYEPTRYMIWRFWIEGGEEFATMAEDVVPGRFWRKALAQLKEWANILQEIQAFVNQW
ncbi:MAG: hypothetical protein KAJ19_22110 [Gammaproteobacteria bacterium]|nr:hypothetical protein [Gammaproteobacteria bacterium]